MTDKLWPALAGLAILAGATWGALSWHAGKVDDATERDLSAGRAEVQARWDAAVADAKAAQQTKNTKATAAVATEVEVVRTVYKDRIKEVTRYVPNPDTHCPADDDFVRMFNAGPNTSPAGGAPDQ